MIQIGKTYETSSGKYVTVFAEEQDGDIGGTFVGFDAEGVKWWFEPNGRVLSCGASDYDYWRDDTFALWPMAENFGAYRKYAELLSQGWAVSRTESGTYKFARISRKNNVGTLCSKPFETFEAAVLGFEAGSVTR